MMCPQMEKETNAFRGITVFGLTYHFWDSEAGKSVTPKGLKIFIDPISFLKFLDPLERTGTCLNVAPIGSNDVDPC